MTRNATTKLLEMVEDGLLDRDAVIMACVNYMSEADVADMMHANEFAYTCAACGGSFLALNSEDICTDCEEDEDDESELVQL